MYTNGPSKIVVVARTIRKYEKVIRTEPVYASETLTLTDKA